MEHNGIAAIRVDSRAKRSQRQRYKSTPTAPCGCGRWKSQFSINQRGLVISRLARESGAYTPCAEQETKVSAVDDAVNIQVAKAARGAAGACTPRAEQETKVSTVDDTVKVQVTKA